MATCRLKNYNSRPFSQTLMKQTDATPYDCVSFVKYITLNLLLCQTLLSAEVKTPLVGMCTHIMENERGKKGEPARAHINNSHTVQIKNSRSSNH